MAADPLSRIFSSLADPTRRAILQRLEAGECTVLELAEPFRMSLPAISRHLKVLERAGLIRQGRLAQWRPCKLDSAALAAVDEWLTPFRHHLQERNDRIGAHLHRISGP